MFNAAVHNDHVERATIDGDPTSANAKSNESGSYRTLHNGTGALAFFHGCADGIESLKLEFERLAKCGEAHITRSRG
jgi:hypothetical protein